MPSAGVALRTVCGPQGHVTSHAEDLIQSFCQQTRPPVPESAAGRGRPMSVPGCPSAPRAPGFPGLSLLKSSRIGSGRENPQPVFSRLSRRVRSKPGLPPSPAFFLSSCHLADVSVLPWARDLPSDSRSPSFSTQDPFCVLRTVRCCLHRATGSAPSPSFCSSFGTRCPTRAPAGCPARSGTDSWPAAWACWAEEVPAALGVTRAGEF